jgi:hypothetical protein
LLENKKMMNGIKITVMMLLISQAMIAQTKSSIQKAKKKVERLEEVITLTYEQKSSITNIMHASELQDTEIRSKEVVDKNAIHDLKKEERAQIKEVLTPEQQATLKVANYAKKEEYKLKKENRTQRKAAKNALLEQRTAFNAKLTPSEQAIIEKARALQAARAQGKKARAAMTGEQKAQNNAARKETHKLLKPIVKSHKAELDAIKASTPSPASKSGEQKKSKNTFYYTFLLMK